MCYWILLSLATILSHGARAQGQASGSAIDLANMNMQMMNTKCALTPCQSACLVRDHNTGCYVCNPSCTPGSSGIAMNAGSISNGQGLYGCISSTNWVQCPSSCDHKLDQMGCFRCLCPGTSISGMSRGSSAETSSVSSTSPGTTIPSSTPKPSITNVQTTQTNSPETRTPDPKPTTHMTKATAHDSFITSRLTSIQTTTGATIPSTLKSKTITTTSKKSTMTSASSNTSPREPISTKAEPLVENSDIVHVSKDPLTQPLIHNSDYEANKLSFILFGVIGSLLLCTLFFLYAWRKALHRLRWNKNELYFIHKAYRQDSNARLWNNDQLDPIYAEVTPDPPPRVPSGSPLTPTAPRAPLRTLSVCSQTPVKGHFEDTRHDYLELI